ncbi:MAG TPA: glycosyltransferase family 39 protein, partial [Thermoanaerobaculia bacterium]|nr:glycosyltransferase family 39 protein [Thermoanaerobaculia bacterium]
NRAALGRWGFDAGGHLAYVAEVLAGRLPLADAGWETYQPPLYYLMAAGWLRLLGRTAMDAGAAALLPVLGGLAAALQCALVWAALCRLFPEQPRRAVLGTVLAAFLPAQLYLGHYVTNEGWLALWSSAALCLTLHLLGRDRLSARACLALGAVLGLAMLTKFSALLTVAAVVAALAGRLIVQRERAPGIWLRTVGAVLLGCLLVCGWHYARVTARFGRPLVGNWDRDVGAAWWQDPGYRTAGDLLRFGRSLTAPLWSAFHSVPDALYSTLWGDGLLGGTALLAARPPWDLELMAAGALLALVPSLGLLLGLGAALARLVRAPSAAWFLLLGVLGATGFALAAMCLRLPFYAQAKAFYGLAALVPLAALGGWGLDLLAGRGAGGLAVLRRLAVGVLVGVWALASLRTYWVDREALRDPAPAVAAALDPGGWLARAQAAQAAGQPREAATLARRAVELSPDHPFAWGLLGATLAGAGEPEAAVEAWREALRVSPADARVHAALAQAYESAGRAPQAAAHRAWAERLAAHGR